MLLSAVEVHLAALAKFKHGTKNWIYDTFDARQKLNQIWYWL